MVSFPAFWAALATHCVLGLQGGGIAFWRRTECFERLPAPPSHPGTHSFCVCRTSAFQALTTGSLQAHGTGLKIFSLCLLG